MQTTVTLNDTQWDIILEAVEDYAVLVSEDVADNCGEILDIIEAERINSVSYTHLTLPTILLV